MKEIKLTQGKFALVDDELFDELNRFKWYAAKNGSGIFYARRTIYPFGKQTVIHMHREVLKMTNKALLVDHIDGNGLNNQLHNLRPCSAAENCRNRKSSKGGSSSYLGVSWNKRDKNWQTVIRVDRKLKFVGYFKCEKKAALAYNEAALKYFGEFANPNIIPESNSLTPQTATI